MKATIKARRFAARREFALARAFAAQMPGPALIGVQRRRTTYAEKLQEWVSRFGAVDARGRPA